MVYDVKKEAEVTFCEKSKDKGFVFKLAENINSQNVDVIGEKPVRDGGNPSYSDETKCEAWKQHYQRLLIVEFP